MSNSSQSYHSYLWLGTNKSDPPHVTKFLDAKFTQNRLITRAEFETVFAPYGGMSEIPCCALVQDLVTAYPESKFLYVERDEDRWFKSFYDNVLGPSLPLIGQFVIWLDPKYYAKLVRAYTTLWYGWGMWDRRIHRRMIWGTATKEERKEMEMMCRHKFREQREEVMSTVPKEKLLVLDLKDGWEPLCKFLDKEVPNVPFPHLNSKNEVMERFTLVAGLRVQSIMQRLLKRTAVAGAGALLAYTAYKCLS